MKETVKKDIKHCAYDLFLCGVAGTGIILACSLAKFIHILDVNFKVCEALGCAMAASVSGVVLLTYSVDNLFKHARELKQHTKE